MESQTKQTQICFLGSNTQGTTSFNSAAFYQIFDGSISIWSSPWFSEWENIYDNLNIQPPPFVYPAVVKDLWIPNQKVWNADLIRSLFTPHTANAILQTPIIKSNGKDTLVWKLTPAGECTSKSAYKHCFNNLALPVNQQPKVVTPQIISLLNHVWQDTSMTPPRAHTSIALTILLSRSINNLR